MGLHDRWPEIVSRAEHEGLRTIARSFGVSAETIRTALIRAGHADLLGDSDRWRRLTAAAPPPPPPTRKIPKERHAEVAELCQHHTQAEVAELFGVSQATIWRIVQQVGGNRGGRHVA